MKQITHFLEGASPTLNFTRGNTPPRVFFTFFKKYKRYQIAQRITDVYKGSFQISHLMLRDFKRTNYFYSHKNHQKTHGNQFA